MLQSLYDQSAPLQEVTCGGHSSPTCAGCPQGHGASWCNVDCMWSSGDCSAVFRSTMVTSMSSGFVELVLDEPRDVHLVYLRFGAQLLPVEADCEGERACSGLPEVSHPHLSPQILDCCTA